jgi:geranylgeranyl reductase family protein
MRVDVAIVGTGPAGGAAANALATSGLSTVVLEQYELPRIKPCGGLLPAALGRLSGLPLETWAEHRVQQFEFSYNFTRQHSDHDTNIELLLVNRARFDAALIERAIAAANGGVELRENHRVQTLEEHDDGIALQTRNGESIAARYVIAADGANSRCARALGLQTNTTLAVAVDAEVEVSAGCYHQFASAVHFNYFFLPGGYGWIFPKGRNVLSCGVGSWQRNAPELNQALKHFLTASLPPAAIIGIKQRGFPLPIFSGTDNVASARCCLVGDAAGLVDPVSGEGIRFAVLSGQLAAQTIIEAAQQEDSGTGSADVRQRYTQQLAEQITPSLERLRRYAVLPFLQAPEFYYEKYILGRDSNAYH